MHYSISLSVTDSWYVVQCFDGNAVDGWLEWLQSHRTFFCFTSRRRTAVISVSGCGVWASTAAFVTVHSCPLNSCLTLSYLYCCYGLGFFVCGRFRFSFGENRSHSFGFSFLAAPADWSVQASRGALQLPWHNTKVFECWNWTATKLTESPPLNWLMWSLVKSKQHTRLLQFSKFNVNPNMSHVVAATRHGFVGRTTLVKWWTVRMSG